MAIIYGDYGEIIYSTPDSNNLTGDADSDNGYNKEEIAKLASIKNDISPNNEMETLNEGYAGTTTAGQAGKGSANKVQSNEIAAGPKPGQRPQNPLASFSSYTYQITLYMITPDAYDAFIQSGRANINAINNAANPQVATALAEGNSGAYIIAQSGGINNKTSKRAFDLDFYIDDLKITTAINGKSTTTASNDTKMTFNIYEPYGFSFISKITRAAQLLKSTSKIKDFRDLSNATKQFFVLGIRFQGYDQAGKEISASTSTNLNKFDMTGDSGGVFERFFDIMITSMKFKIDGKTTVYNITAAPVAPKVGFGVKYGRIDNGARLEGSTVHDALTGTKGLLTTLNEQQVAISKKLGTGSIPNVYKLEFLGNAESTIGKASIVSIADLDKSKYPMSAAANIGQVNESVSVKTVPNSNRRTITFTNDVSIMQAVSSIVSQSSYLEDALNVIIKSETQPDPSPNSQGEIKDPTPESIKWYNLGSRVKVLGFDTVVKDFAYEITYIIQPYETPAVTSPYAGKTTKYYGAHKRYEYWFTGKNSEIIHYEQKMDNAYFTVALNPTGTSASTGGGQNTPTFPNKRQNEDRTGKLDVGKEAQNSYLTSLYDPGAYATAKVTILGDPDYLMQESPGSVNSVYRQFYGRGFTINPNGGQVFIEIDFKEGEDYNNEDGLLSINDSILFWKYPKEISSAVKGVSYMVTTVDSNFSKGKFTQDLQCIINTFPDISTKNSNAAAGRPIATSTRFENTSTQAAAETNRLANAGNRYAYAPNQSNAETDRLARLNVRTGGSQTGSSGAANTGENSSGNTGYLKDNPPNTENPSMGNEAAKYNTNQSSNAASEPDDENVVNPKQQPANQGGRDEPVQGRPRGGA